MAAPIRSTRRRRPESEPLNQPAHESAEERQELFDHIAPIYDKMNDVFTLFLHRLWKKWSVSWSGAKEGDTVLDACCGSGDISFRLSEKVGITGKVIGLDFSRELLQVAASRQHDMSNPCYKNIEWIEGDATKLPFPDSYFDAATIGYGLRNVVDRKKALEEMVRVLKPGSKLSVLDFNKNTSPFHIKISEWVLDHIVVPVATWYGLKSEYAYLKPSINGYLTGEELEKLALESGFSGANFYKLGGGFMGNLVAIR